MQIRPTNNIQNTSAVKLQTQTKTSAASNATTSVPVDQLNISAEAQMMSAASGTEVRADRIADIRAQIAGGQYETSEKLDIAIGRMLNEIG